MIQLILLTLSLFCYVTAYGIDPRFRPITVDDGLNSNTIRTIYQDQTGYMWIGTNEGLVRIAGNRIESFTASNGEVINGVWAISEGKSGNIWIGSKGDLYRYSPHTSKITPCGLPLLKGTAINSCQEDNEGDVWIATHGKGIWRYSPGKETKRYAKEGFTRIVSLIIDHHNTLWALSDNGLWRYDRSEDRFNRISLGANKKLQQSHLCLYNDFANNLWIGGKNGQLLQYNIDKRQLKIYSLRDHFPGIRFIRSILQVEPHVYYVGTNDGLVIIDTDKNTHQLLKHHPNNPLGLNDNFIHALYKDREGGVWLGTYFGGLNYLSPQSHGFSALDNSTMPHPLLPTKHLIVGRFVEGPHNEIYIGTDNNGVWRYTPENDKLYKLPIAISGVELNVHALAVDGSVLWIGTFENGIIKYNLSTHQWCQYSPRLSLNLLFRDSYGDIWAGALNGTLYKYNKLADQFTPVHKLVTSNSICDATEDGFGDLWFATFGSGLLQYNRQTESFINHRDSSAKHDKSLRAICYFDHKLWIGTSGYGLCYWDSTSQQLEQLEGMKLPVSIYFVVGHKDKLWMTTNRGVCSYSLSSRKIAYYGEEDGLLSNHFNPNAGVISKDKKIYVGGSKGVTLINPTEIGDIEEFVPLVFTDFKMYNTHIKPDSISLLSKDINYTEHINLPYHQNAPGFDFMVLTHASHKKIGYKYRLKGYDKQWNQLIGSNSTPSVSYMNLSPGNYVFEVGAFNQAGNAISEIRTLSFTILAPWWNTLTMRILYLLVFIAFLALFIYFFYRRLSIKQSQRYKTMKEETNRQLLEAKIRMFQDITHEIRTPVTLISGPVAEVLRSPSLPDELREDIGLIKKNSDHLVRLMDQVLDFSKFESEYTHLHHSSIDLFGYTLMLVDRFRGAAKRKGITITAQLPNHPCSVLIDVNAYDKIVSNILSNAIKYAQSTITLSMPAIEAGSNHFVLSIGNNGEGIEDIEKIFNLFYRDSTGMTQKHKGFGIGLTIVKLLVDKMKGEIEVANVPNQGAVFSLKLPFTPVMEESTASASGPDQRGGDAGVTLLLAEDNRELRAFITRYLKRHYQVIAVENGQEALIRLRQNAVDIVISDIMMPEMDGLTLCDHIKQDIETSHIPVILLTAVTDVKEKIKGLERGADIYVEKPVTMEFLHAQIENLIKQRRKLQQRYAEVLQVEKNVQDTQTPEELFIEKVRSRIIENLADADFSVDDLSKQLGMGRTATFAKIKAITGYTPSDYIRMHRLHQAAEMLKSPGDYRINEICYLVGFSTPSYFSKCFQQRYGVLPSEMAKKYTETATSE